MRDYNSNVSSKPEEPQIGEDTYSSAVWAAANDTIAVHSFDYSNLREVIDKLSDTNGPDRYLEDLIHEFGDAAVDNLRADANGFNELARVLFALAELAEGHLAFQKVPLYVIDYDAVQVGCYAVSDGHVIVRGAGRTGAAPLDGSPAEAIAIKVLRTFSKFGAP